MPDDRRPPPTRQVTAAASRQPATFTRLRVLVIVVLVGGLVAAFGLARASAQQPGQDGSPVQLLASSNADRIEPVPLDELSVAESEPVFIFADVPDDDAEWVAFYLDLAGPEQLSTPDQVETGAPFDLAGTNEDGQAQPLDTAELEPGAHRVTAIIGRRDGSQELTTSTFQLGEPTQTPSPTPLPTNTPDPSPSPAPPSTTPPSTQPPEVPEDSQQAFGVHQDLHYGVRDGAIQAARDLGATVSRSSFLWDKVEPQNGQFDWSAADQFISQLVDAEIQPLLYFVGSPEWANGSSDRFTVPTEQAAFERWVTEYAQFAEAAAERYRGQVTRWEIGNEPNQTDFWKPTPDPDRYRQWYVAMRQAVLRGNPEATVAIGGLTGLTASGDITGTDFLSQLVASDTPIDAVSIHPYSGQGQAPDAQVEGENDFTDIELVHQLLEDAGYSEVPLWVTEWGWSSGQVGAQTQAEYVAGSLRMLKEDFPYVTVATYFLDYDREGFDHGLLTSDLTLKPAAEAFTAAVSSPGTPAAPQPGAAASIQPARAPPRAAANQHPTTSPPRRADGQATAQVAGFTRRTGLTLLSAAGMLTTRAAAPHPARGFRTEFSR